MRFSVTTKIALFLMLSMSQLLYARRPVHVSISPSSVTTASAMTVQFTATVKGTTNQAVTWTTTGGSITSSGLFTAPTVSVSTTVIVTATSQADTTKKANAQVTVNPVPPPPPPPTPVAATRFGVDLNFLDQDATLLANIHASLVRFWNTTATQSGGGDTTWYSMCPNGVQGQSVATFIATCDFTRMHSGFAAMKSAGISRLDYALNVMPVWAAKYPTVTCAHSPAGTCGPPANWSDLDSYLQAIRQDADAWSAANSWPIQIFWGIYNEPNGGFWYEPTPSTITSPPPLSVTELVTFGQHVFSTVHNFGNSDKVLTPDMQGSSGYDALNVYLNAGGAAYADIAAYHSFNSGSFSGTTATPEVFLAQAAGYRAVINNYAPLNTAPLWNTEFYWYSPTDPFCDDSERAAYISRSTFLLLGVGLGLTTPFHPENVQASALWHPVASTCIQNSITYNIRAGVTMAGQAWNVSQNWLLGNTLGSCVQNGTAWQCSLAGPNGYLAIVAWDTAGGSVASPYSGRYSALLNPTVYTAIISGTSVATGHLPILIENLSP